MFSKSLLLTLISLSFGSTQELLGSYQAIDATTTKCIVPDELVLREKLFVRSSCSLGNDNKSGIKFGLWNQMDKTIKSYFSDGTSRDIIIKSNNQLIDGNDALVKVDRISLDLVADIFGNWKADPSQSMEACSVANSLEVAPSGQILRYFCKDGQPGWFEKGFFRVEDFHGSTTTLISKFNGTDVPMTLQLSKGSRQLLFNNKVTLYRA